MRQLAPVFLLLCLLHPAVSLHAQGEAAKEPVQVLTQEGYDKTAPAVVKLVSDAGKRIGGGVLVGLHADSVGFVLTA